MTFGRHVTEGVRALQVFERLFWLLTLGSTIRVNPRLVFNELVELVLVYPGVDEKVEHVLLLVVRLHVYQVDG